MHGCEGRPDISLHIFLMESLLIYLFSWYILKCKRKIYPADIAKNMSNLWKNLWDYEDNYYRINRMIAVVLCVIVFSEGIAIGLPMIYSIAIIPRGCTVPPSVFARVFYWIVGGVFGLLGLACLVITVGGIGYTIYKRYKWIKNGSEDDRRAKRLLQTVNRASLGAQSRVTVLYEDIRTALEANSEHSKTFTIAHTILSRNIINLCTVYASDVCGTDSNWSMVCTVCQNSIDRTDLVVVLYGTQGLRHRECISSENYFSDSFRIRNAINGLRSEVNNLARGMPLWDVPNIRMCRAKSGIAIRKNEMTKRQEREREREREREGSDHLMAILSPFVDDSEEGVGPGEEMRVPMERRSFEMEGRTIEMELQRLDMERQKLKMMMQRFEMERSRVAM